MAGKIADYGVCVSVGEKPKYLVVRVGESGWPGKQPVMNDVSRYGWPRLQWSLGKGDRLQIDTIPEAE